MECSNFKFNYATKFWSIPFHRISGQKQNQAKIELLKFLFVQNESLKLIII